jgi:hypothetical protein
LDSETAQSDEEASLFDNSTLLGMILGILTLFLGLGCFYAFMRSQYSSPSTFGGNPNVALHSPGAMGAANNSPERAPSAEIDRRPSYAERRRSRVTSNSPMPDGVGGPEGLEPSTTPADVPITPRGGSNYAAKRPPRGGSM